MNFTISINFVVSEILIIISASGGYEPCRFQNLFPRLSGLSCPDLEQYREVFFR
jgi:hypothetical protein